MSLSYFRIYGGFFQHILPLYIARSLIRLYQPLLNLYRTFPIWTAAVRMALSVAWHEHVPEGKAHVASQFCYVMIEDVLKPLGLQPMGGFCGRLTASVLWVIGIVIGGCLARFVWPTPVYHKVKKETIDFWNALIHHSLSLFDLADKYLRS